MEQKTDVEIITVSGRAGNAGEWKLGYSDRAMALHLLRGVRIFREHLCGGELTLFSCGCIRRNDRINHT